MRVVKCLCIEDFQKEDLTLSIKKKRMLRSTYTAFLNLLSQKKIDSSKSIDLRKFLLKPKTLKKVKVKVLGTGDIKVKVNIMADKFSKSAQAKIEKAGGKIETVK